MERSPLRPHSIRWSVFGLTIACSLFGGVHRLGHVLADVAAEVDDEAALDLGIQGKQTGVIIEFKGDISGLTEQYLYRKLDAAQQLGASVVVIEIDSPGGEVEATIRMAERLRDTRWAKTVAFIPRQALSGAALFSLGCDEIVMAPQAVFGDAGPIFLDEDFLFKHASEKVRSHLARQVRDLAEAAGRPPALAEAMVDMNLVVYRAVNRETQEEAYLSQDEIDASQNPAAWEKLGPVLESRKDHFLEVNGRRAVELTLADAVVTDRSELKQRYAAVDGWVEMQWSRLDAFVLVLNNPFVTGCIFLIGLGALYFEFAAPGLGIGGVLALVCFGLFFWSRFLGGTAEWLDVILFLAGCALLVVELFVIPGFGIWGLAGIALITVSVVMANQSFVIPRTDKDLRELTRTLATVLMSSFGFAIFAGWLTRRMGSIPGLNRLMLKPPVSLATPGAALPTETMIDGRVVEIGERGRAESPLRPAGRIRVGDDHLDVVSDGSFIEPGAIVEVVDVRGNRVVVRQVDSV